MYNTIKNYRQYKPQKNSRLNFFISLLSGNRSEMLEFSRCSRAIKKQLKDNVKKILAGSDDLFLFVLTSYLEDVLGNPQKKQLFDLLSVSELLENMHKFNLNIISLYKEDQISESKILAALQSGYMLSRDELNTLQYPIKNNLYYSIKSLQGVSLQVELSEMMHWERYYNMTREEKQNLDSKNLFSNIEQKIKLLQKVWDYIPIEDQMKITEIDAHSLNRLKSLHIQYSLMNYTDKSAELIESAIPQMCTALDDIEARYIQTIDKEAKVEKLYLRKL